MLEEWRPLVMGRAIGVSSITPSLPRLNKKKTVSNHRTSILYTLTQPSDQCHAVGGGGVNMADKTYSSGKHTIRVL